MRGVLAVGIAGFARERGLNTAELFNGLGIAENPRLLQELPWADAITMVERLAASSPEMATSMADHAVTQYIARSPFTHLISSPWSLYRAALFIWPRFWGVITTASERNERGLRVQLDIPAPHRPSTVFFHVHGEVLRLLPKAIGLPEAAVEGFVTERRGLFQIQLDEPDDGKTNIGELFFSWRRRFYEPELNELHIPAEWELTAAEQRLVQALVNGQSPKDFAKSQNLSHETVRTHLKRAMSKAGVHRQAELVARVLKGPQR